MKIALIQQRARDDIQANIKRGVANVRAAAASGAGLVVFPELSFLPFFPQKKGDRRAREWAETIPGSTTETFRKLSEELDITIVINLYERSGDRTFDSSPVLDRGRLLGTTRMAHIIEAPCFHEKEYYHPGEPIAPVFDTSIGKIGVAICYDRHYPEYMRELGLKGADLVVVPQAGAKGEWPEGIFEAELQVAAFQNGYFAALSNRVGEEECLTFAGESYVVDPLGRVIARAPADGEVILYADIKMELLEKCAGRRHFLKDRRPEIRWF